MAITFGTGDTFPAEAGDDKVSAYIELIEIENAPGQLPCVDLKAHGSNGVVYEFRGIYTHAKNAQKLVSVGIKTITIARLKQLLSTREYLQPEYLG